MSSRDYQPKNPSNPVTQEDKARVQSSVAKANDGQVPKGSQASRMQSAADKNTHHGHTEGPGKK